MLDNLRNFARTWPGKILGIFMLIGLAGFGMSGVFTSISSNIVAKVGKEEIKTRDFQRLYSRQLNEVASQIGSIPTPEQAIGFGIASSVLNSLAAEASLNGLGKKFRLGVSDRKLGELVRQDPAFNNALGSFDAQSFRNALRSAGWTEKEYFEMQTKSAIRQQLILALFSIDAPKSAKELATHFSDDRRNVEYFIISRDNILPPPEPTKEQIKQYLTENEKDFQTEPKREVAILLLSPEAIGKNINISEQELLEEYERTKANFNRQETRTILQLALNSDILVNLFTTAKEANLDFNDIIAQNNLTPEKIGTLAKSEIIDSELAEKAFSLNIGEYAIIPGIGGKRVIYVEKINEGGIIDFAKVKDDIKKNLQLKQGRALYIEYLDQIEEQRAAFVPLKNIADKFNLELKIIKITQSGKGLEEIREIKEEHYTKIASAIFSAKKDALAPSVSLGANQNLWFDILTIEPARSKTLIEASEEIKQILIKKAEQKELKKIADRLVDRIKNGEDFAQIALSGQFPLLQANNISRLSTNDNSLTREVISAMFAGDVNHFGSALDADGNYVIFKVLEIIEADKENAEVNEFINNSFANSIYSEFVNALREEAGLKINQQTLNQIISPNNNRFGG